MTDLDRHLDDYLRVRRALGFKLTFPGRALPQFVRYLQAAGASTVTVELAVAWAGLPAHLQPISRSHRLGAARSFARYLATVDPATEVPPRGLWPSSAPRRAPYLWSDADIAALLTAARGLRPALRSATLEALFGLLACSGMRVGEALRLGRHDVDLTEGVITVREAKCARTRLVPLHPSATAALRDYCERRDMLCPARVCSAFFVSTAGSAPSYGSVLSAFVALTTAMGLRTATPRPRIHDLRHSFAVRTLVDWHRSGADVEGRLGALSTYLGHVDAAGTYWYLSAAPELMELAAARLDRRRGARP
ncbi:MAG: tyrosine-type recombinase/integrase [Acidimicrobiales bacterium]